MSDPTPEEAAARHAIPAEFGKLADESQEDRNARKLLMIAGDANGMPDDRCVKRLARMIPRVPPEKIPAQVREFVELHELGDALTAAAEEIASDEADLKRRREASIERNREMRDEQVTRSGDDG